MVNSKKFFTTVENLKQPVFIDVAKNGESLMAKERKQRYKRNEQPWRCDEPRKRFVCVTVREKLMSVKKLTEAGVEVIFQQTNVIMKINGEIIATGKQRGNGTKQYKTN